jgi:predicted transcriptional regulator
MELKEIRKQLPHGAIREISKRAKVTEGLVSRIYNGQLKNSPKEPKIKKATAEYLAEYKTKEREANEALKAALNAV